MKKSIIWTLVIAMLLSVGFMGFNAKDAKADAEDITVSFTDEIDIMDAGSGVESGANSGHGNHQHRVVRTTHGEYAAYITDEIGAYNGKYNGEGYDKTGDEFSIIKIDAENGTTTRLYTDWKPYDSSQLTLAVDNDENVWAIVFANNAMKDQFDGRDGSTAWCAAYCVDAATDEVIGYKVLVPFNAVGYGFSYASSFFDPATNKIVSLGFDGDNAVGNLVYTYFDVATREWAGVIYKYNVGVRHGYPFFAPDGNGGFIVICQEDKSCAGAGYPEIGNNVGLTAEDLATFHRWSADYVWDTLNLYHFSSEDGAPTVNKTLVALADYSRVVGEYNSSERLSLEGRKKSEYPNNQMNNGGDMIIDQNGYLHVVYDSHFALAAYDRSATESKWIHQVYDISNPANVTKISESVLTNDVETGESTYWRLYEDTDGCILYVGHDTKSGELRVYYADGTPSTGYTPVLLNKIATRLTGCTNVANMRGNSLIDNTIDVIYLVRDDNYNFRQIKIHHHTWSDPIVDQEETCTTPGEQSRHCTTDGCDARKDITEIPATHLWDDDFTIDQEPTCEDPGSQSIHCHREGCDEVKDVTPINPQGHLWDEEPTVDKEPTCTDPGSQSIHCGRDNCDATKDAEAINPLGHEFVNGICTRCGQAETGDTTVMWPYIAMMAAALCLAGAAFFLMKRKNRA